MFVAGGGGVIQRGVVLVMPTGVLRQGSKISISAGPGVSTEAGAIYRFWLGGRTVAPAVLYLIAPSAE
jgi:hypothetical protein